jgi:hypothetical protein
MEQEGKFVELPSTMRPEVAVLVSNEPMFCSRCERALDFCALLAAG